MVNPAKVFVSPYAPSWANRLTDWIARLPGPSWLYYFGLWVVLFTAMTLMQWSQGGYPVGTFNRFHIAVTASSPLLLLLLRYLNRTAQRAMENARPLLETTEAEYQELVYRLTTLPARAALVATFFPLLFVLPNLVRPISIFEEAQVALTPPSVALTFFLSMLLSSCAGVLLYQMYREMRLVNLIYKNYARVDLFHLSPLYGFSRLTSQAALALLATAVGFYIAEPRLLEDVGNVFTSIFGILVCLAVFLLPLIGAHNRILAEKEAVLGETTQRIKQAIQTLHTNVDAREWNVAGQIKDTLTGLDIEQKMLERIPTWPWQPETPRILFTALFIPLMLFVIQFVIQKMLAP